MSFIMSTNTSTSYTFAKPPTEMTPLKPVRYNSYVKTYSGVDHFSWGSTIIGKEIELTWPWLSSAQYEKFQTFYESENVLRFFSSAFMPTTYYCQMLNFDAAHWYGTGEYLDGKMTLLIMGTAT